MKMNYCLKIIINVVFASHLSAQNFSFCAALDTAKRDGLHAILLTPDVRMRSQQDLEDLRLRSSGGKDVPYAIIAEPSHYDSLNFIDYPILTRQIWKNKNSVFIFSPAEKTITSVWMALSNHRLVKKCTVSGSDDQKQWFGIISNYSLPATYEEHKPIVYCPLYLPEANYRYYKIVINDSTSEPLNVHRLGYFRRTSASGKLIPVSSTISVEQDLVNKRSLIHVRMQDAQHVNSIELNVASPQLFERTAKIIVARTVVVKRKKQIQKDVWFTFRVSSGNQGVIQIPPLYEKEFTVEIENKDSPQLEISSLTCGQHAMYIIAYLRSGEGYKLFTGNSQLRKPEYDLASFVRISPAGLPSLSVRSLTPLDKATAASPEEISFFEGKLFIWLCVGLGAILVLLFSFGLLRDMRKEVHK